MVPAAGALVALTVRRVRAMLEVDGLRAEPCVTLPLMTALRRTLGTGPQTHDGEHEQRAPRAGTAAERAAGEGESTSAATDSTPSDLRRRRVLGSGPHL